MDTSLVVATYSSIASEFGNLSEGPWLLTSYLLGYSVALPVVGGPTDSLLSLLSLLFFPPSSSSLVLDDRMNEQADERH